MTYFCPKVLYVSDSILHTWTDLAAGRWRTRVVSETCQIYCLSLFIFQPQKAFKQWGLIFKMHLEYSIQKDTQICRRFEGADLSHDCLVYLSDFWLRCQSLIVLLTFRKPELLHKHARRELSRLTVVLLKVPAELLLCFYGIRAIQKEKGTEEKEIKMYKLFNNTWWSGEGVRVVPVVNGKVGRGDRVVKHHLLR